MADHVVPTSQQVELLHPDLSPLLHEELQQVELQLHQAGAKPPPLASASHPTPTQRFPE